MSIRNVALPARGIGTKIISMLAIIAIAASTMVIAAMSAAADQASPSPTPADNGGEAAAVIPALTDWQVGRGAFELGRRSRILVGDGGAMLKQTAETLAEDLKSRYGHAVPVLTAVPNPRPGDILLRLDPDRDDLGDEGYELRVGDAVQIIGGTDDGAFYGARTVLQALTTDGQISAGRAIDVPRYPERGVEICPCMIKISMARMERLLREMAYLKLNYLLLPLKMISQSHPEANQWSYYTPEEARRLAKLGRKYHVEVVPEINAPGHMEPFLFDRPDLQLTDENGNRTSTRMDITKPEAFAFYTDLIDEYVEVFPGQYWHMGADEYMTFSSYDRYPQIGAYAREKFGPDARPEDAFIDFVNRVSAYVKSEHGRRLRIWNDGLPRRNIIAAEQGSHPRLDTDIVIEHWLPGQVRPSEFVAAGYTIMNAASSLYEDRGSRISPHNLCPDSATLADCVQPLWENGWSPAVFEDGSTVDASPPRLTGAHLSMWQTTPDAETERQMEEATNLALRLLAQRTWGQSDPFISYEEFVERADQLSTAPGYGDSRAAPISEGTYTLGVDNNGSEGTLAPTKDAPGGQLRVGSDEARWQVHRTDDGYYRLESPTSGLCADMDLADGATLLESDPGVGDTPELQPCDQDANTQKWEVTRSGRSTFVVTNALSQLVTRVASEGTVIQDLPDRPHARWYLQRDAAATMSVETSARLLEPSSPNPVHVTVRNHGQRDLRNVELELEVPDDWQVRPLGAIRLGTVAAGDTAVASFDVTPAAGTAGPDHLLSAAAHFSDAGGPASIAATTRVRVDPIVCGKPDEQPSPVDDEFDGTQLDGCRWSLALNPDLDTMSVGDGQLRIVTESGDLVGGPPDDVKNVVLQPAAAGDWTIETKMEANLEQSYQQGGLITYGDDDNYVEFVLATENPPGTPPNLYFSLVSEMDGEFRKGGVVNVFGPPGDSDEVWWLRLTKSADTFTAQYSADGDAWRAMPGEVVNPNVADPDFGLLALGPFQQSSTDVGFDHFRMVP